MGVGRCGTKTMRRGRRVRSIRRGAHGTIVRHQVVLFSRRSVLVTLLTSFTDTARLFVGLLRSLLMETTAQAPH